MAGQSAPERRLHARPQADAVRRHGAESDRAHRPRRLPRAEAAPFVLLFVDIVHNCSSEGAAMLLEAKVALIHGAGGAIGGAVSRALAGAGARVFLAGRTRQSWRRWPAPSRRPAARPMSRRSTRWTTPRCRDMPTTWRSAPAASTSRFNAIGVFHVQGVPLAAAFAGRLRAAGARLHPQQLHHRPGGGAPHGPARQRRDPDPDDARVSHMAGPGFLGHCVACAGVEAMTRHLAGELGASGVRGAGIRSHAIPETAWPPARTPRGLRPGGASRPGVSVDADAGRRRRQHLLKRLPTLDQLAQTAVFLASPHAARDDRRHRQPDGRLILD